MSWQDALQPTLEHYGYSVAEIDPKMGNIVVAFFVNECIEPLRFPVTVVTLKTAIRVVKGFRK